MAKPSEGAATSSNQCKCYPFPLGHLGAPCNKPLSEAAYQSVVLALPMACFHLTRILRERRRGEPSNAPLSPANLHFAAQLRRFGLLECYVTLIVRLSFRTALKLNRLQRHLVIHHLRLFEL